ncbi:MAG: peptidoglycan bridge formation glycyltransferase FemA/FemB family protein [Candidatus Aminicenantes bacterium]|nr:MAG: peptidoglycan bridge formation glycyltransferase FemA/FemB family protein [Candidatus Aminicenantes bacterium]
MGKYKRSYFADDEYRLVSEIERRQWSDFVLHHPQGNIFQTPEMYEVYKNTKNYTPIFIGVVNPDNHLVGTLLANIIKEYSSIWGNLTSRSIIRGGPIVKDNNEDVFQLLLTGYNNFVKNKVIYTQVRNLSNCSNTRNLFEIEGYTYEEHLDILIDLTKSEDNLEMQMHKERRHNIRRAINKGTTIEELKKLDKIKYTYELIKETHKRVKHPLADESLFHAAYNVLHPKKMIRYFFAVNNNKIIGVRIVLCYKEVVYDWYAGSTYEDRNKYPNDLLPWKVVLWSKRNGYKVFDFGGAGKPGIPYGVRNYKLKFGGHLVNFGRYIKIHKPLFMKIGTFGFKLYRKVGGTRNP